MLPIKYPSLFLVVFLFVTGLQITYSWAQAPPTYIQVDQFGYLPDAPKVAVLHDPVEGFNSGEAYIPGSTLELKNAQTGMTVFMGSPLPWRDGNIHAQSGDRGWWFDFSSFQTPGTYFVSDPSTGQKSATFEIGEGVYREVLNASMKMYYYNRCNAAKEEPFAQGPWTDGTSFDGAFQDYQCRYIYDVANPSLEKDLSGGWFDAGDFNKYVTFANSAVHNLLWAYRENPQAFGDNENIPESGNGIPDILDEIKWEIDWLLKMNNADGSTHIKMGSRNYGENKSYPPSANTDPRYYGPTCTAASIAVAGMFAHAATVFKDFPAWASYADQLRQRAESSWAYVAPRLANNQLETACDDGSIVAGDADWDVALQREQAVASATFLYELTGTATYNQHIIANARNTEPLAVNFWGPYKFPLNDALLLYTQLPNRDGDLAQDIINSFQTDASNNYNGFFGFNDMDLFRAFMPDWAYHWGSNSSKAGFGVLNQLLVSYGIAEKDAESFRQKTLGQLHYFHGVNPLGMVHLSNMYQFGAEHCVNQIYHQWFAHESPWDDVLSSPYGPAPGFVTGGPNKDFTVTSLSPPSGQPPQKAYLDFNEIPTQSWEITEPAIYYQAIYVRLLANFVDYETDSNPDSEECELSQSDKLPLLKAEWSQAGHQGEFPIPSLQIDVVQSFGAKADGQSNDGPAIQQALNAALPGAAVYLPAGQYRVENTLKIPEGVVLQGACSEDTRLIFDLGGQSKGCIEMLTYAYGNFVPVVGGMGKGSTRIRVSDPSEFSVGSFAEIEQNNDPALMYTQDTWNTDWAQNSVGQMLEVLAIEGDELIVSPALMHTYSLSLNPQIRPSGLLEKAGIEDLGIVRKDGGVGPTIHIKNAVNCWVKNIASDSTVTNHVLIDQSFHIEVINSYFRRSHDYGGGGRGYGVNCSRHTTLCLVENNIFQTLRHAMMVKQGASGNVFGYNYSLDPVWEHSSSNIPPDISLHGHYPSLNLFEGNIVQELTSSDYWGPSGPGNTFFRNRVEQSNLSVQDASHNQQIVGNELSGGNTQIAIDPSVNSTLIHGNNVNGNIQWISDLGGGESLPASLYLCEKPEFFGALPLPSIGPEFPLGCGSIPTKLRFDAGIATVCKGFVPSLPPGDPCYSPPRNERVRVYARVFLEGLYRVDEEIMNNSLNTLGVLPLQQPFAIEPFNYQGTEVLSTLPDSIVDWLLVEVRNPNNPAEVLTRRAGLINYRGYLLDPGDLEHMSFPDLQAGEYLLALYHRSHLAILSSDPISFQSNPSLFDFSAAGERAAGSQQLKPLPNGSFAMYCGDYDGNGVINNLDFNFWKQESAGLNQYLAPDGDGNAIINNLDFNLWKRNVSKIGIPTLQE